MGGQIKDIYTDIFFFETLSDVDKLEAVNVHMSEAEYTIKCAAVSSHLIVFSIEMNMKWIRCQIFQKVTEDSPVRFRQLKISPKRFLSKI